MRRRMRSVVQVLRWDASLGVATRARTRWGGSATAVEFFILLDGIVGVERVGGGEPGVGVHS